MLECLRNLPACPGIALSGQPPDSTTRYVRNICPRFAQSRRGKPRYIPELTIVIMNRRTYRELQAIDRMPKRDRDALTHTIDTFLSKGS